LALIRADQDKPEVESQSSITGRTQCIPIPEAALHVLGNGDPLVERAGAYDQERGLMLTSVPPTIAAANHQKAIGCDLRLLVIPNTAQIQYNTLEQAMDSFGQRARSRF